MTLSKLRVGQRACIADVCGEDALVHRFSAMGLRVGREACLIRRSWLGGALQVRIGGTHLIMRRADADRITIQLPE
ncbi:MAG TPA: FeoA family protein [Gammaproteobacteria bacterium]|nr:FeoA family protein [Gammaproteobacteria bacterium]